MSGTPTGTVNFTDGSTTLGTGNLVNGTATITGDFAAGTHSIVATYSGDATFATSASASSSVTADQTTTTSLVALSQDPIAGQNVVLTSNVISSAGTPTGTMTFTDGSTTLGTVSIVNGSATITGNFIAGAHQILATYNGDAGFAPSISATMPVTADPTASATAGHTLPAIVASVTPTAQLIKYTLAAVNSGVHLYGKTTVWSRNGHVAFSNINIKQAGTYLLMISTPGQGTILQEAAVITPGPASTVVFTTQPANTTPSSAFSVAVTIEDAYKNIAISAADAVTLSLRSHGKQATLIGTTVVSPANGTVMFANLSVPSAGTYRLLARYGTAGAATFSTVFTVATAAPPL
jgi:hypothetical protein